MKKIKIKICEFDRGNEALKNHFICQTLKKYYDVEMSENPDYIFYNDSTYEYLKYNCIRIFFTGENITPNFNLCDYGIGFDYMDFGDRYYRFPLYLVLPLVREDWVSGFGTNVDLTKAEPFSRQDLAKKNEFCSFVYSNYLADEQRIIFFDKLSVYKKVNSAGAYLNNMGGEKVKNKLEFELKHKFSIAFENSSRIGYTTEKLTSSLAAKTIPVYWGNPEIGKEFNAKRFINCHEYENFDQVVKRVKEIDNDDELFLSIMNEQIVAPNYDFDEVKADFEKFLCHIISQPLPQARRRVINTARAAALEEGELVAARHMARKNFLKKLLAFLYKPFKKIAVLERLKQKILARRIHKNN